MRKDKPTFYTIVVLLIIFIPMSIYGTYLKLNETTEVYNVNEDFYFNGSLYFYENGNLLGTYECISTCGYATSSEEEFIDNYYTDGTTENLGIINSTFTFLQDGEDIFMYNISSGTKLLSYENIKFYNTVNNENIVIVKFGDFWGAVSLDNMTPSITIKYDELSIGNITTDGVLDANYVLAKSSGSYMIIDSENKQISSSFDNEIVDYTKEYIITYNEKYQFYSYEGEEYLDKYEITDYKVTENYIAVYYNKYILVYSDISSSYKDLYVVNDYETFELVEENNIPIVYIDGVDITND